MARRDTRSWKRLRNPIPRWRPQNWRAYPEVTKVKLFCEHSGKQSFRTWEEAESNRPDAEARGNIRLRTYKCEWCRHFHFTSRVD